MKKFNTNRLRAFFMALLLVLTSTSTTNVLAKADDTKKDIDYIKKKIEKLRIFEDDQGKMNLSVEDEGGELLIVSQFTLYGDARKGNRPSFINSSSADKAEEYYEILINELKDDGFNVKTGKFQTHMEVSLINDGPVTIQLDSERLY